MAPTRTRPAPLLVALGLAVLSTSACGGATGNPPPTTPPRSPIHLDEHANHTSVSVAMGTSVVVTLHSTYWSGLASSTPTVLTPADTARVAPGHTCPPGTGCGTVELALRAVRPGRADVTARRTSCGEARACTGDQGRFKVAVTVGRSSRS